MLDEIRPNWRHLDIHEAAGSRRGISAKLKALAPRYVGTQFSPHHDLGTMVAGKRNEDLERLTFPDETFDIHISLDVMEHVYDAASAFGEIWRTLKPGGIFLSTFPVRPWQEKAVVRRFEIAEDGSRIDHMEPEIHGSPVPGEGSLVTIDWGYNLHQQIAEWANFDVRVYRFCDKLHGILGPYTEVILCTKPGPVPKRSPMSRLQRLKLRLTRSWCP